MSVSKHNALRAALDHLEKGEWDAAHKIVQSDDSPAACWVHGIVHVMEGDLDNARYWYSRAKRAFSEDLATELAAVKKMLP
ncbi:MAG TPA: hypothetical protein VK642_15690 [Burkholderiales bacterium]|nr:hypothetical protein [Burkholderiales bacterium]